MVVAQWSSFTGCAGVPPSVGLAVAEGRLVAPLGVHPASEDGCCLLGAFTVTGGRSTVVVVVDGPMR
jgi:hypothetical protein